MVLRWYQGVLGGVEGVLCIRNRSGRAGKWTCVSPCLDDLRLLVDLLRQLCLCPGAYTRPLFGTTYALSVG